MLFVKKKIAGITDAIESRVKNLFHLSNEAGIMFSMHCKYKLNLWIINILRAIFPIYTWINLL